MKIKRDKILTIQIPNGAEMKFTLVEQSGHVEIEILSIPDHQQQDRIGFRMDACDFSQMITELEIFNEDVRTVAPKDRDQDLY